MTKRKKRSATSSAAATLGRLGGLAGRGRVRKSVDEKILSGTYRPGRGSKPTGPRSPFDPARLPGLVEAILGRPVPPDVEANLDRVLTCPAASWWPRIWAVHGARIVRAWLAAERPGTRPLLWWKFVAPGRRARRPLDAPRRPPAETLDGLLVRTAKPIAYLYESEAHFLRRHGLLLEEEARRLKPEDLAPTVGTTRDGLAEPYSVDPELLALDGPNP